MKHGFIGFGNMAQAIYRGLKDDIKNDFAYISKSNSYKDIESYETIKDLVYSSDVVWLCVKPQILSEVLHELKDYDLKNKVIVSIIAGKTIGFIEKSLGTDTGIVKIMPNLAIEYKKSVTAFCSNHRDSITESIRNDLGKLGKVIELEEEKFDSFTAVFGSGPAFLLEILKPFQSKINELGLSDREGGELLEELLGGTFEYFSNRKEKSMNNLIDSITSKGGVTQAGLECFNSKGGHKLIENILSTAENKTKEFRKDIDD